MARHKEFDQQQALYKAMETFCRHGYEGTSIQLLVDSMGINRGSLYDTFGGKHDLFVAALEHYWRNVIEPGITIVEAHPSPLEGVMALVRSVAESAKTPTGQFGCLATNSAAELGPHAPDIAQRVRDIAGAIEDAILGGLERGRATGEIRLAGPLRPHARMILAQLQGLRVLTKVYRDPDLPEDIVRMTDQYLRGRAYDDATVLQ